MEDLKFGHFLDALSVAIQKAEEKEVTQKRGAADEYAKRFTRIVRDGRAKEFKTEVSDAGNGRGPAEPEE